MKIPRDIRRSTQIETRELSSGETSEIYITAVPAVGDREDDEEVEYRAKQLYTAVREKLTLTGSHLLSERLFASAEAIPIVEAARKSAYGELDDGVPPTRVVVSPGNQGRFAGAQVHAICGPAVPEPMRCSNLGDGTAARLVSHNGQRWLFMNGLEVPGANEAEQARRMFFCTGCFLRQAGGSMTSVARTWLWLKDVCAWYDDLNRTRTAFFEREGLINREPRTTRLPASTGIGLGGASGAACTIDLVALPGREDEIELVEAGGDQRSAFEYGSAFSRASVAPMPGGRTVFVSGTAAIDSGGATEHVGEIERQIEGTIAHVRSILANLGCDDSDVLTSLAYCKDSSVERVFRDRWSELPWPRVTMLAEVCRPELLFEMEVTASSANPTRRRSVAGLNKE